MRSAHFLNEISRNAIKLLDYIGYPKEIIKKSYLRAETLEKYM